MSPRTSIEGECGRRGRTAVVTGCLDLLAGRAVDDELVRALAGPPADSILGNPRGQYWLRVWGARGLLYAWEERAVSAVVRATGDESWRVREMAAKVIARHRIDGGMVAVAALRDDPVQRVRAAGSRALVVLTVSAGED